MVQEIRVDGDGVGTIGKLKTVVAFVRRWKRESGVGIADWVSEPRPWYGVIHTDGVYMIEAKPGSRAAAIANQIETRFTVGVNRLIGGAS